MNRAALDSLDRAALISLVLAQTEVKDRLTREHVALLAEKERLTGERSALLAEVAGQRAKLDHTAEAPENSSVPPSRAARPRSS
jgi:hypothetical protein